MAGAKIKGLTVEIGGDTTKLGKALDNSEKQARSLQVELRQVERLLKFDPGNVELLAQKQEILSQSIEETSQKLKILKEAQSQVEAQFQRGDIGADQYRAFQREVMQTENSLNKLESELKQTTDELNKVENGSRDAATAQNDLQNDTNELTNAFNEFGESTSGSFDKAKNAIVGVGTVLGGAAALAYKVTDTTAQFDQAFNQLIARTGASKREFDSLNQSMETIYKNGFGESIEDVANAMATVKVNTGLTGSELEKTTQYALLLSDTFDFDVNESTRTAQMLMTQYGLSAEQAYNLIAQGAQNGLDKNGDLLDTINEYSVHFKQLGIGADEMFNMLVNGAESGTFSVDKLGDAVKEFGIRVKDGTADDAFKALGLSVDETKAKFGQGGEAAREALSQVTTALFAMDDPIAQNAAGVALFGTMWEDLGVEGVKALMNVEGGINNTNDALSTMNDIKYDDIGSALEQLGRTIETDIMQPVGEELQPVVEELIDTVSENAPTIAEVVSSIASVFGEFVSFVVSNSSRILGLIVGVGAGFLAWNVGQMILTVVSAINLLRQSTSLAALAQAMLNSSMLANPILLLVALIAGIVAAIITFIATNENARQAIVNAWEAIKSTVGGVVNELINFFTVTIPNAWNSFITWLPGFISSILAFFQALPGQILSFLLMVVANWILFNTTLYQRAVEGITNLVTGVINIARGLPQKIYNAILSAINLVTTWGNNVKTKAVTAMTNTVNGVYNTMKQIPSKVTSAISGAISAVTSWGSSMVSKARSACNSVASAVTSALSSIPGKVRSIGSNIVSGLWGGISGMASWVRSKVSSFASSIVSSMKSALKINSPSKVMRDEVGRSIPEGIVAGIDEEADTTLRSIDNMADNIIDRAGALNGLTFTRRLENTFTGTINTNELQIRELIDLISNYLPKLIEVSNHNIVLDSGKLVGATINKIDAKLAGNYALRARGI